MRSVRPRTIELGSANPARSHRVERLLIVQPQDDADVGAAASELEDLPGVVGVTLNTATGAFDILLDPVVVSDDELAAALHHQGYDLASWQEVRAMHAVQQRSWLLEQIRSLAVTRGARARRTWSLREWCHEGFDRRLHPNR